MLPVCHRDDDAAKGFSKSDQDDSRGAHDSTNGSRSTFQESVREEITQDMDVDKNSQWTIGVNMQDVEGVVVDMEKDHDSFMDIYPTASELAFHSVLELLDEGPANSFLMAIVA